MHGAPKKALKSKWEHNQAAYTIVCIHRLLQNFIRRTSISISDWMLMLLPLPPLSCASPGVSSKPTRISAGRGRMVMDVSIDWRILWRCGASWCGSSIVIELSHYIDLVIENDESGRRCTAHHTGERIEVGYRQTKQTTTTARERSEAAEPSRPHPHCGGGGCSAAHEMTPQRSREHPQLQPRLSLLARRRRPPSWP